MGNLSLLMRVAVAFAVFLYILWSNTFSQPSSQAVALTASADPHDFGSLAEGCRYIYFDVGSNIGIQVRKLFQPELYPKAKIVRHFDAVFGSPEFRKQKDSGICVFGFEANPKHTPRLKALEKCYNTMGWRVHFFAPGAVGSSDGNISFFSDGPRYEDVAASIYDHGNKGLKVVVPLLDLAKFLKVCVCKLVTLRLYLHLNFCAVACACMFVCVGVCACVFRHEVVCVCACVYICVCMVVCVYVCV
jgi:hypothetical protein